ncbi:putative SP-containing membrane protein [Vairimorpha necatrix]|uniref:SP-containing membrane protein n=1 Tax=Vairimorpha necatrix TaxID=6039 RepID=A0AAX4JC97_9MICR
MKTLFFIYIFLLFISATKTNVSEDNMLDIIVNSEKICNIFENRFQKNNKTFEAFRSLGKLIWDTITGHDIFKKMTEKDNSQKSFANRSDLLRNAYLEYFDLKGSNYTSFNQLTKNEKNFIDEVTYSSIEYYNLLLICYKDIINNSNSTTDAIKKIIIENMCYIESEKSNNLPSLVYKYCKDLFIHYKTCYGTNGIKLLYEDIKNNYYQLQKAQCINNDYDFKNITETFTVENNTISNNITEVVNDKTYNMITNDIYIDDTGIKDIIYIDNLSQLELHNTTDISSTEIYFIFENKTNYYDEIYLLIFMCIILMTFFTFLGYKIYKRRNNEDNLDLRRF